MAETIAPRPASTATWRTLARPVPLWRSYAALLQGTWRSMRVHRVNLVVTFLGSAALQGTQLAFIGVLLHAFGAIAGWSVGEVALLYGLRLTAHGVCTINFGQHRGSAQAIRNGEWDRYLLRPVSPLVQMLTRYFNPGTIGDLVLGLAILVTAAQLVDVTWTSGRILYLVLAAVGGGLVEAGLQIGISGLDFRWGPVTRIKDTIDRVLTDFGAYPMSIFGTVGNWLLTFLVPLAFMAYLPMTVLLGRTDELVVPLLFAQLSPFVGPLVLRAGILVFSRMSRWYSSPGN
ncbi:ABC transporter permease [Brachybacterium endophyticum]|uniref:ABC transporter permease n=1 Tax=Brachybacterium endophyticum TaxID=2182385 RepID=UPI001057DED7|nr:ABC-2 family transporter protein [Brachybacterium endophyticum]